MNRVDDADLERYRAMTPNQRLEIFVEVCELADAMLRDRPDRDRVLAYQEPLSEEAERTWRRLVAEARSGESSN